MKTRRSYGTGSLEPLPSGSTRAIIRVNGRRLSKTFKKPAAARTWIKQQQGKTRTIDENFQPRARLRDLVQDYLADMKVLGRRQSTIDTRESHMNVVIQHWGDVRLADLTGPRMRKIGAEMAAKGWAAATIRNRIDCITTLAKFAMETGVMEPRVIPVRRPPLVLKSARTSIPTRNWTR